MLYVQVVTTSAKNVLKQEYTEVNQIVHAQMVNTSYQIKLVVIVQFNVTLVKFQVLIVTHVEESENQPQIVDAQMNSLIPEMMMVNVLFVNTNVIPVLVQHLIVLPAHEMESHH